MCSLNLAICWKLLRVLSTNFSEVVKILRIGQSAGNQRFISNLVGSSETIRQESLINIMIMI